MSIHNLHCSILKATRLFRVSFFLILSTLLKLNNHLKARAKFLLQIIYVLVVDLKQSPQRCVLPNETMFRGLVSELPASRVVDPAMNVSVGRHQKPFETMFMIKLSKVILSNYIIV